MNLLDGLRAFTATAETGSFTAGAERLGVSNRLTSKHVAELEAQLGVRLFQRTTRKLGLTTTGEVLLSRAPALLEELDSLLSEVSEGSRGFTGGLRISAPVNFGERHVQVMLAEFAALHPSLSIDLRLSDAHVDLAAEGIDLAFRIGFGGGGTLKRRKLGEVGSVLVASPDYLAQNGEPRHPALLGEHRCLSYSLASSPESWRFTGPDGSEAVVRLSGPLRVDNGEAMLPALCAGLGIGMLPDFICEKDIAAGRLKPILQDWKTAPIAIHIVTPPSTFRPRRVTALIDFLTEKLSAA